MKQNDEGQEKAVYEIDPAHTNIGFKVKHMMVAQVNGRFSEYDAQLEMTGENFEEAKLKFTAKTASIDTNNSERDEHLRSPDFFNARMHPEIRFQSYRIKKKAAHLYEVKGKLEMNGIERKVILTTEFNGILKDPDGVGRIPLIMKSKINRLDWKMIWNRPLESGGILVSKEVNIIVECEFL